MAAKIVAARKYSALMKLWNSRCTSALEATISVPGTKTVDDSFFVLANTEILTVYTEDQRKDIAQRTTLYKNIFLKTLDELIAEKLITPADKALMKGKVTLQYVTNCSEFDGKISLKQRFDSNKSRVKNELIGFNINVNICFEPWFGDDLESSVKQIIAHELGHFFYYFHDKTPKLFEALCRTSSPTIPSCTRKSFVSDYAMSAPEEDYAESFAFWFLKKLDPGKNSQLIAKKSYFDNIFRNLK